MLLLVPLTMLLLLLPTLLHALPPLLLRALFVAGVASAPAAPVAAAAAAPVPAALSATSWFVSLGCCNASAESAAVAVHAATVAREMSRCTRLEPLLPPLPIGSCRNHGRCQLPPLPICRLPLPPPTPQFLLQHGAFRSEI